MSTRGERLSRLADVVGGRRAGDVDPIVLDVTHDSRQVGAGSLFVAVRGMTVDGHRFIDQAVERGAVAVVCEEAIDASIPHVVVDDARASMARLAALVHGRPSRELAVVGLTGTNGKTSVSFILESMLRFVGRRTGLIGTIVTRIDEEQIPTLRTTPESTDFQRLLREMANRGAEVVVSEVSSHALRLGRVDETWFEVVGFTNLSQDHLDFHSDMEDYYRAKRLLFDPRFSDTAVICVDDDWGRRLANDTTIEVRTVSMVGDGDLTARIRSRSLAGTELMITFPDSQTHTVLVPLLGDFNAENALVAAGCALELGLTVDEIVVSLAQASAAPGRFELVSGDDPLTVIVDYAHTPDGVEAAIESVRNLSPGRVIAVIGAGGDRDRAKRPLMGAAGSAADVLIVTSDNPRTEDPQAIIDDILTGVSLPEVESIVDRRSAIRAAVDAAADGDVVLVLGKGHERSQEIGDRVLPFDDRLVSRTALADRRERTA
ncbi:MAG: UDP-N-acetylmuramoyl-L-alanyl-D-glutamate--2,6-diaminopimelate ligase [Acidimicrobiia bacterium]|nr:UDP-N-acetylmuramoyl-L-alanyl-D-glutamate--2,6-diaminopimelate ligase [Acidimicrobiia bacterium]